MAQPATVVFCVDLSISRFGRWNFSSDPSRYRSIHRREPRHWFPVLHVRDWSSPRSYFEMSNRTPSFYLHQVRNRLCHDYIFAISMHVDFKPIRCIHLVSSYYDHY